MHDLRVLSILLLNLNLTLNLVKISSAGLLITAIDNPGFLLYNTTQVRLL